MSIDHFKSGDIRSYDSASAAELGQEKNRLRDEVKDPKLSAGEYISTTLYNAIVIGATLAPLAFVGVGALAIKSPGFRKLTGLIGEEGHQEIEELRAIKNVEEWVSKARDIIKKYTGKTFGPLEEAAKKLENTELLEDKQLEIITKVENEAHRHFNEVTEKAGKRLTWTTALTTFGGSSIVGTAAGISKARKDKAIENSSKLSHAERVLNEREEKKQAAAVSEEKSPGATIAL